MWCSKDFDAPDVGAILSGMDAASRLLIGILPLACIGWELSLWLSPTQVQELIDAIAPRFVAYGCRVGTHFQQGYSSYQQDGEFFYKFWERQIGKLEFHLHQRILGTTPQEYREASGGLQDVLERFAGHFSCPADSGFGHAFDLVAWEITCANQFDGSISEDQGDAWGSWAMKTPRANGPAGVVGVMGSGNGLLADAAATASLTSFTGIAKHHANWRPRVGRLVDLTLDGRYERGHRWA